MKCVDIEKNCITFLLLYKRLNDVVTILYIYCRNCYVNIHELSFRMINLIHYKHQTFIYAQFILKTHFTLFIAGIFLDHRLHIQTAQIMRNDGVLFRITVTQV